MPSHWFLGLKSVPLGTHRHASRLAKTRFESNACLVAIFLAKRLLSLADLPRFKGVFIHFAIGQTKVIIRNNL